MVWASPLVPSCDDTNAAISASVFFLQSTHAASLRGITFRPQSGYSVVFFAILCVLRCYAAHQRIRWVTISEKRADWEKNFWDCQCWAPIVLEDVQTDDSLAVDVAVIDACAESHLGWLERVFGWEVNIEKENTTFVNWAGRSQDRGNPLVDIVALGTGTAIWRWI